MVLEAMKRSSFVLVVTVALFCVPPAADLLLSDERRPFAYAAADSFYYLTVARNIVDHGLISFDQIHLTNGFHPLWQVVSTALWWVGDLFGATPDRQLALALWFNIAAMAGGLLFLLRAMAAHLGRLSPMCLLIPVGAYALLISPVWWIAISGAEEAARKPLHGTMWSFVNGMSSSVLLLCFGLSVYWFVCKPVLRSALHGGVFGLLLALLCFARLDHVFLVGPVLGAVVLRVVLKRDVKTTRVAATMVGAFVLPMVLYLIANHVWFGSAMPVSGKLKTTFPSLCSENFELVGRLVERRAWKASALNFRLSQLWLPVVFAMGYVLVVLVRRLREGQLLAWIQDPEDRLGLVLWLMAIGIAALGIYNALFVYLIHQGHWYLPVSILFVSLCSVRSLGHLSWVRGLGGSWPRLLTWTASCAAVTVIYFVGLHRHPRHGEAFASFYFDEAPKVMEHYREASPDLFSWDDGIIAFSTGFRTLSGTGFVGDPEAIEWKMRETLGDLAVDRGFDRFTSLIYFQLGELSPDASSDEIEAFVAPRFCLEEKGEYQFSVDYRGASSGFAIIRVEHVESRMAPIENRPR